MTDLSIRVAFLVATLGVLLFQGVALYLAAEMPRLDPPAAPGRRGGARVSAIIAARNEEEELPGCLDGLLAQTYPNLEVLVVDGGSTDRTREVARARAPRVRLIEEPPLPEGWVGKNWACDVGYRASSGEWLLFLDADVRCQRAAVEATVALAESEGADLATLAPRVEMLGVWEKVVLPFYIQMVLTYFRTPRVNRDRSSAAMANGQYFLTRRSAYAAVGGHEAVRGAILEDVQLARRFRAAGRRLRVAWAPELVVTRMYRDRHEMAEGLLKNIHGVRFSALRQLGFLVGLVGLFWLPLLVLPVGLLLGSVSVAVMGGFLVLALFGKHVVFSRAARAPAAYGLLYPVAVGFYVVLVARSLYRGLAGRPLLWKGRSYAHDGPGT